MMKLTILTTVALFLLMACENSNALKQSEFYVRGNCSMCEDRIESAMKSANGVVSADWNVKSKNLSVTFDSTKTDEMKLQQIVANVGHETKTMESPVDVHDALPACCKKGASM